MNPSTPRKHPAHTVQRLACTALAACLLACSLPALAANGRNPVRAKARPPAVQASAGVAPVVAQASVAAAQAQRAAPKARP